MVYYERYFKFIFELLVLMKYEGDLIFKNIFFIMIIGKCGKVLLVLVNDKILFYYVLFVYKLMEKQGKKKKKRSKRKVGNWDYFLEEVYYVGIWILFIQVQMDIIKMVVVKYLIK